jgi:cell division cycle 2-like protein
MNSSFTGGPALTTQGFDLLERMLHMDPAQRISAEDALKHEYFKEKPLRKHEDMMPTFPATNAQSHDVKSQPFDPLAGILGSNKAPTSPV